jgi:hypothetical protein
MTNETGIDVDVVDSSLMPALLMSLSLALPALALTAPRNDDEVA